ncbi:MAG: lipocalin family protein [Gemmataceae bacterium]|nr:lipocalin family protein [Gemmataceae bacterium]
MRPLAACLVLALAAAASAQDDPKDKSTAEKLVGTWQLVESDEDIPEGVTFTVELTADNKITIRATMKGSDEALVLKGKYKVDGNKIDYSVTTPDGGKKQEVLTIKKLTDDELVTVDPEGVKEQFKRVKAKKPAKDKD